MTAETTADVEAIVEQVAPPIEAAEPVDPIIAGDIEVPPAHVLDDEPVVNMEHLQLQREEAFFLQWAIGSLRVRSEEVRAPPSPLSLVHVLISSTVHRTAQHSRRLVSLPPTSLPLLP